MNFVAILGLTQISPYSGIFVLNTTNIGPKEICPFVEVESPGARVLFYKTKGKSKSFRHC
jgi:hypothetical protein